MIDDDHRGYLLELLSAKLLSMGHPVQIIGMSATISVSYSFLLYLVSSFLTNDRISTSCPNGSTATPM